MIDTAADVSPLDHYNLAVSYYKLEDYDNAETHFLEASVEPKLRTVSFYNLGLVAKQAGQDTIARSWFAQTQNEAGDSRIATLAGRATDAMGQPPKPSQPRWRRHEPKFMDMVYVDFETGYASNSNVFRSPAQPYVDLSDPLTPTVTPIVSSGTFVPVYAQTELRWGTHEHSHFNVSYEFDGRIYSDAELSLADEMAHSISIGGTLDQDTRRGNVYTTANFTVSLHDESAFDRDTGDPQTVNGIDITDRFNYMRIGPEVYYHRDVGWFGFGFDLEGVINKYDMDPTLSFLDLTNSQFVVGAHVSLRPFEGTSLRLSHDWMQREYDERIARDLDGLILTGNETTTYDYSSAGLAFRQRIWGPFVAGIDYRYTDRIDKFLSYDTYKRHSGRVQLRVRTKRLKLRASATMGIYDFPNAFAYNNPAAGEKTLDVLRYGFDGSFRLTRHFYVDAVAAMETVESSDARSEYDQTIGSISLRYRY